ncbi:MAG: winged helix-turn-helix domain-containing protein [Deltaproteobacteria bacterium]
MVPIYPGLPWLKYILDNFNDYDEERQQFIEQQLEDIMSRPTAGRLVREHFRQEALDWVPAGRYSILERFYAWLEGSGGSRADGKSAAEDKNYCLEKRDQSEWRVEEPRSSSGFPLLDLEQALVFREGRQIPLTPLENGIMNLLYSAHGRVVTHRRFEEWAQDAGGGAGCYEPKYHIRHLREKLGDDPRKPRLISNRRGIGYCLSTMVRAINT